MMYQYGLLELTGIDVDFTCETGHFHMALDIIGVPTGTRKAVAQQQTWGHYNLEHPAEIQLKL